ncbi:MAG: hypothetical protein DRJ67_07280, partial [Thermoprotei archaeon]
RSTGRPPHQLAEPPPPEAAQPAGGEVVLYYGYLQPYYLYVTNRRIAGVKSRKRALLQGLGAGLLGGGALGAIVAISAAQAIGSAKDAIKREQQEKLLNELNTKKKNFEFYWEQVRVVEVKKPGLISGGYVRIVPFYGREVKIKFSGGSVDELLRALNYAKPGAVVLR